MSVDYWPWWVGGPLLAVVAVLFPVLAKAPLGVSGALARLLRWGREGGGSPDAGGGVAPAPAGLAGCGPGDCQGGPPAVATAPGAVPIRRSGRGANLVFLIAIAVGGGLAGWAGGRSWGDLEYAPEFQRIFGAGVRGWVVLFLGGLFVGFGTRLSGGCTSGHGLSGCGRLQPASLLATAVFFGVAIGVSFLLQALRP